MKPPCPPHCELRKPGCHSICPIYAEFRQKIDSAKEERAKEAILDAYFSTAVKKAKRNMSRTKGALKLSALR